MIGRLTTAVLLFSCAPVAQLHSQLAPSPNARVWLRGGFVGTGGLGALFELAGQYKIVTVEARVACEFEVVGDLQSGYDAGLLVGVATPAFIHPVHLSLSAGIAHTWFSDVGPVDCPGCPDDADAGAALALALHVSVRPTSFLGIGFFAYSNRNEAEPFGGSGVMIELGLLR